MRYFCGIMFIVYILLNCIKDIEKHVSGCMEYQRGQNPYGAPWLIMELHKSISAVPWFKLGNSISIIGLNSHSQSPINDYESPLWSSIINLRSSMNCPDNKFHGATIRPTWALSAPDGPHVCPMNLAIRVIMELHNGILELHKYSSVFKQRHK